MSEIDALLRALALNTESNDRNTAAVERLAGEFEKLRAQAPVVPPETPADRIAQVAGETLADVLARSLGGGKRRKK